MVLTDGIPPEFRSGVHLFIKNRHTPSGQSRVYRVTQLRTDGVHCRESASTGPVNLKVVPDECCLGRSPMDQLIFASLSHTYYWYEVGMLKVMAVPIVEIDVKIDLISGKTPFRQVQVQVQYSTAYSTVTDGVGPRENQQINHEHLLMFAALLWLTTQVSKQTTSRHR